MQFDGEACCQLSFPPELRSRKSAQIIQRVAGAILKTCDVLPAVGDDTPFHETVVSGIDLPGLQSRKNISMVSEGLFAARAARLLGRVGRLFRFRRKEHASGAFLSLSCWARQSEQERTKRIGMKRICGVSTSSPRCARPLLPLGIARLTARLQAWRAQLAEVSIGQVIGHVRFCSAIPWYRLALQTPLTTLAIFVAGSLILKETYPFSHFPCFRHRQRPGHITW